MCSTQLNSERHASLSRVRRQLFLSQCAIISDISLFRYWVNFESIFHWNLAMYLLGKEMYGVIFCNIQILIKSGSQKYLNTQKVTCLYKLWRSFFPKIYFTQGTGGQSRKGVKRIKPRGSTPSGWLGPLPWPPPIFRQITKFGFFEKSYFFDFKLYRLLH